MARLKVSGMLWELTMTAPVRSSLELVAERLFQLGFPFTVMTHPLGQMAITVPWAGMMAISLRTEMSITPSFDTRCLFLIENESSSR